MDRDAIARAGRRRRIEEAVDEEREREEALVQQLEEVVTEGEGSRIDERAFARMSPEDVALVREALEEPAFVVEDEEHGDFLDRNGDEQHQADVEEEIARLQAEIAASQRRRVAYERYLQALDS
jgi:hypothetical protein